jgi:hypothetical protein
MYCLCGCGEKAKQGNRYILGHNAIGESNPSRGKPSPFRGIPRSQEVKDKISISRTGKKLTEEHKKKLSESHIGLPSKLKGVTLTEEHKKKLSIAKKGKPSPKRGIPMSNDQRRKLSLAHLGKVLTEEHRNKISISNKGHKWTIERRLRKRGINSGNKCHFWKGGVTKTNEMERGSLSMKLWRETVFSRDDFTCQHCSIRGGRLHPHHIKRFADCPDLRYEISNGLTLCISCHRKVHRTTCISN